MGVAVVETGDGAVRRIDLRALLRALARRAGHAARNPLGASIRRAGGGDLDTICRLYVDDPWLWLGDGPRDEAARGRYLDRLRRGEQCWLAFVDGVLAHANWTCFNWGDALPGHPIRLRPRRGLYDGRLHASAFRGKGVHALVLGTMLLEARRQGARQAYTLGQVDRPDAHKGLRALGWQECGRIYYFLLPAARCGAHAVPLQARPHGSAVP